MPELIQKGITGEVCEPITKIWSHMQSYTAIPDFLSIYDKMIIVYRMDTGKTRKACRKWIEDNFDFDKIYQTSWKPLLEGLEKEIYGEPVDKSA